ncbi:PrgI family protein [Brevibacillus laterosporus]|uniref:PrgI family protein n=1 Tax=Brevibacillus halotolerans TaxID=1507437 RepID=A0ABT4I2Y3_9BACL|nr:MULTISPECIES: PrgI family protein [Brevibacillus]MCR8987670.1 PrgI family protein [Brevibacillus laterosporus]MCZ0833409.1 PrgI family protein [Brevibacillus halotolerans]
MYQIPKNVKARFEFFTGFGMSDLVITSMGALLGAGLFYLAGLFTNSIGKVFLIVLPTVVFFLVTREHPLTKRPLYVTIFHIKQWKSNQRLYLYKFGRGRRNGFNTRQI